MYFDIKICFWDFQFQLLFSNVCGGVCVEITERGVYSLVISLDCGVYKRYEPHGELDT